MHTSWPVSSWYEPAGHAPHSVAFECGLAVPLAHGVAASEPIGQKVPGMHLMHCSADVITARLAFWCVPPGQGSGAADPSAQ